MTTWLAPMLLAASGSSAGTGEKAAEAGPEAATSLLGPLLNVVLEAGMLLLVIAMMICIYRLLRGPTLADRVTASDTLSFEVTGLVIVLAIRFGTTIFFDTALAVAIVGFISTVAFAQYIGAGGEGAEEQKAEL